MTRHHLSADFGSRLRQLRRDRSMTAVDLAKRVKVTPPAIWHWEHRGRTPKSDRLQAVADSLGVSRRPSVYLHPAAAEPMAQRAHDQCDRAAARGVQTK